MNLSYVSVINITKFSSLSPHSSLINVWLLDILIDSIFS